MDVTITVFRALGHGEGCGQRLPVRRCGTAGLDQISEEEREVLAAPVIYLGHCTRSRACAPHRADQQVAMVGNS